MIEMKNELKQKYYILFKLVDGSVIESDEFPSKSERDIAFNEIMEGFYKHKVGFEFHERMVLLLDKVMYVEKKERYSL